MHGRSNGGGGVEAVGPDGGGGLAVPSSCEKEGIAWFLPKETTWRRSDKEAGEGWILSGLAEAEGSAAGCCFFTFLQNFLLRYWANLLHLPLYSLSTGLVRHIQDVYEIENFKLAKKF